MTNQTNKIIGYRLIGSMWNPKLECMKIISDEVVMIDAEKLQRLIELAETSGWSDLVCDYGDALRDRAKEILIAHDEARIFFDHSFIKALCKAKYGDLNRPVGIVIHESSLGCNSWQDYHLGRLAISENRIDYLWEQFGKTI